MDRTQFAFAVASRRDEPDLRRLVRAVPMPGPVSVRFEREPDYFHGCDVMGDVCDVLIARHLPDGELAGFMCRSERAAFVEGEEAVVGGVGQVRISPHFRGRSLLRKGWPIFGRRELLYTGVIARGNRNAVHALVTRAPGAPKVTRIDGVTTLGIVVGRARRRPPRSSVELNGCRPDDLGPMLEFLRKEGRRRGLFPIYRAEDFSGSRMRDLRLDDVFVARRHGAIVGTMACWDQRGFKQDVVHAYQGLLARVGPAARMVARGIGHVQLPAPGEQILTGFAALVCVQDDDAPVFDDLLRACLARARERGLMWLMIGFADSDPLLRRARRALHVTYAGDLYAASWGPMDPAEVLAGRPCYVDVATL